MVTKRKPTISLCPVLMLAVVLTGIDNHASADIFFSDFSTTAGLNTVSDAQIVDDRLRITPAASYTLGAAWFDEKQSVYGGFQTTFQFQLTDPETRLWVDGRSNPVRAFSGEQALKPTLTATMSGDTLHELLLGTLPLGKAISGGHLRVKGSIFKAIKLEELFHHCQAQYPQLAETMLG